ncbi:MAG: GGDEF domain-containing protein [Planctomycetota bacterium]
MPRTPPPHPAAPPTVAVDPGATPDVHSDPTQTPSAKALSTPASSAPHDALTDPPLPDDTPWYRHCSLRTKVAALTLLSSLGGMSIGLLVALSPQPFVIGLTAATALAIATLLIGQAWAVSPVDRLLRWVEGQGDAARPTDLDRLPTHRDDEVGRIARALHAIAGNAIRQRIQAGVLARRFDDKLRSATRKAVAELRDEAMRDELTGLGNRKAFNELGPTIFHRTAVSGTDLIAVAIDLDYFKSVNDTLGHAAGDAVLKLLGELIQNNVRERDLAVRLGGDEFVILMAGGTLERATAFAESLRNRFARRVAAITPDTPKPTDLSIGLACRSLDRADDLDALLAKADQRLYAAKREGRGRTIVADPRSNSGSWAAIESAA